MGTHIDFFRESFLVAGRTQLAIAGCGEQEVFFVGRVGIVAIAALAIGKGAMEAEAAEFALEFSMTRKAELSLLFAQ